MMGATSVLALTCAVILEEGFPRADLGAHPGVDACDLQGGLRAHRHGDTKVMGRGEIDGIVISTTGVAITERVVRDAGLRAGDRIVVTGTIGYYGCPPCSARHNLGIEGDSRSDVAPLNAYRARARAPRRRGDGAEACGARPRERALGDGAKSGVGVTLDQNALPISEQVRGAAEGSSASTAVAQRRQSRDGRARGGRRRRRRDAPRAPARTQRRHHRHRHGTIDPASSSSTRSAGASWPSPKTSRCPASAERKCVVENIRILRRAAASACSSSTDASASTPSTCARANFREAGLQLARDPSVRAVVLCGTGHVFCSGGGPSTSARAAHPKTSRTSALTRARRPPGTARSSGRSSSTSTRPFRRFRRAPSRSSPRSTARAPRAGWASRSRAIPFWRPSARRSYAISRPASWRRELMFLPAEARRVAARRRFALSTRASPRAKRKTSASSAQSSRTRRSTKRSPPLPRGSPPARRPPWPPAKCPSPTKRPACDRLDHHLDRELDELERLADGPDFAEGIRAFFEKSTRASKGDERARVLRRPSVDVERGGRDASRVVRIHVRLGDSFPASSRSSSRPRTTPSASGRFCENAPMVLDFVSGGDFILQRIEMEVPDV